MNRRLLLIVTGSLLTAPAYADLFREVTADANRGEFEKFLQVYRNHTNRQFVVHVHADNPSCDVDGQGSIIRVKNNSGGVVGRWFGPGFGAQARTVDVPAGGRIDIKFRGHWDSQEPSEDWVCMSSVPRGYYQLSEPLE